MKIFIEEFQNLNNKEPLTLTIGNFDGIHIGHQQLIKKAVSFLDTKNALMSFTPHPAKVLKDAKHKKLMSLEQKIDILKKTSLNKAFFVKFTKQLADLTPKEYINFLKRLNVKRIVVGNDFRFGAYAKGSVTDLKKHFEVIIVEDVLIDNIRVSSTHIKDLIYSGDLKNAASLLGRPYEITGVVIHGDKVGRTLGIPTANLEYNDYLLPKKGVYFAIVELNKKEYAGALNIGYNPTINISEAVRAEVHLLDFNKEIYGKDLKIKIMEFLRPELKFKNKKNLISQLEKDVKKCEELYFSQNK